MMTQASVNRTEFDSLLQVPVDQTHNDKQVPESVLNEKDLRKQKKKEMKARRRLKREGKVLNLKNCDLCAEEKELLIRCQTDDSLDWKMVCGKCWKGVSGGVVDGDSDHPYYRYGGLWKAY